MPHGISCDLSGHSYFTMPHGISCDLSGHSYFTTPHGISCDLSGHSYFTMPHGISCDLSGHSYFTMPHGISCDLSGQCPQKLMSRVPERTSILRGLAAAGGGGSLDLYCDGKLKFLGIQAAGI
jgi:hypothetical protein